MATLWQEWPEWRTPVDNFDYNQPRNDRGEWTSGGSALPPPSPRRGSRGSIQEPAYQPGNSSRLKIKKIAGVSDEFHAHVLAVLEKIPPPVRDMCADEGHRVALTTTIDEYDKSMKDTHPRGWSAGAKWQDLSGAFYDETTVLLAEKSGLMGAATPEVIRHELGHAVDKAIGRQTSMNKTYSESREFRAAYEKDVANLSFLAKLRYSYQLQKGSAGPSEAFAEAFAGIHGGAVSTKDFNAHWPHITAVINKKLGGL